MAASVNALETSSSSGAAGASQASGKGTAGHRRLDVQGLRAIAVIVVVCFHASLPVPGGFVGVDIFFVISGFVIIGLLYGEVAKTGHLSFANFFTRRARRILPALSLLITVTMLGAWLWLSPLGGQQNAGVTGLGAAWSVANWVLRAQTGDYFNDAAGLNPLLHTWSLSVEEQFYFVFPALMLLTWTIGQRRLKSGRTVVAGLLVAIGLVSFIGAWYFTGPLAQTSEEAPLWAFYGSMFRVWEFAVGGFLAVAVVSGPRMHPRLMRLLGVIGILGIVASVFLMSGMTPTPGPWTAVPVFATALVIYAGTGTSRGAVPGLASKPMTWVGDLSYSWYLWHWPMIVFATVLSLGSHVWVVVAAFGSLLPAWLSYQFFEQPIRRSHIRGRRIVALAVVFVAVPSLGAIALTRHADAQVTQVKNLTSSIFPLTVGVPTPASKLSGLTLDQKALLAQVGQWDAYETPCLGNRWAPIGSCTFFGNDAPRAVIVGDSHAGAASPGFLIAAHELGLSAEVITSPGCPFNPVTLLERGTVRDDCDQRNQEILDHLLKTKPELVVIANRSPRFVNPEIRLTDELQPGGDPQCVRDPATGGCLPHEAAVTAWAEGLGSVLDTLQSAGIKTAVFQTVPENEHSLEHCTRGSKVDLSCLNTRRSISWDRRKDVISAESAVAADHNTVVLDPFNLFCDATTCHQYANGILRYRNDDHLSVFGSQSIAGAIKGLLSRAETEDTSTTTR